MARVYKTSERIEVQIEDVTFWIKPLTFDEKKEVVSSTKREGGSVFADKYVIVKTALKKSVKKAKGLESEDGEYELKFDDNGELKDSCIDDLANIPSIGPKLVMIAGANAGDGLTETIMDENNQAVEGVKVFLKPRAKRKK